MVKFIKGTGRITTISYQLCTMIKADLKYFFLNRVKREKSKKRVSLKFEVNNVEVYIYWALVAEMKFRSWCTNQCWCPRIWYVGGSRPDGAQVGRFSSWGTTVPKGFLAKSAYFSSRISHLSASLSKRPSSFKSESALHQRGPLGKTLLKHW